MRKANPEKTRSSAIGWLTPSRNVLKGEKPAPIEAVPTETASATSFPNPSRRVRAQSKGMKARHSSYIE